MNATERNEFRAFCRNAADNQIVNIASNERMRAERFAETDDADYYVQCAEIAADEAERRGLR